MNQIIKTECQVIEPEVAQLMLDEYPYPRQRPIRKQRVDYYVALMQNDEWDTGSPINIAFAPNGDGQKHGYLVNGQHRLRAVIKHGQPVPFVVIEHDCPDIQAVNKLYGSLDTGEPRNLNDVIRAQDIEAEFGLNGSDEGRRLSAAVAFIFGEFHYTSRLRLTPAQRIEWMRRYSSAARAFYGLTASTSGRNTWSAIRRAPTMAVALITLDESSKIYGDQKVADFWTGIARDDGLRVGDPRKAVVNHLMASNIRGHGTSGVDAAYSARYIAYAFNKWVLGKEMHKASGIDAKAPIHIAGSKFTGR